jgi:hypothetical protein
MTYGLLFYVEVASLLLDRGVMIYFKTGLDKREIVCICSKSIVTISIEFQPVGFFLYVFYANPPREKKLNRIYRS